MEESLKKFLELQKEKAERDEQSNAVFKSAIEEILNTETPPVVEPPVEVPPVDNKLGAAKITVDKVTDSSIKISWENGLNAEKHKLHYKTGAGGWDAEFYVTGNSFELNELPEETEYVFLVQSRRDNPREIVNSAEAVVKTLTTPPDIPEGLTESIEVNIELFPHTDNTQVLQNQLDNIPNGSNDFPTNVYFPKGRFQVEGVPGEMFASRLWRKHNIRIHAEGCELFVNQSAFDGQGNVSGGEYSNRRQFVISRCENVKVYGFKSTGANSLGIELGDSEAPEGFNAYISYRAFEHNFWVQASKDIELIECHGLNAFGDGFCIGGGDSTNIILTDCISEGAGRQGIAVYDNVDGITITRPVIIKARRSGIDLETDQDYAYIRNVEIGNGEIECHLTPFAAGGAGDVSFVNIHHNKYSGRGHSVYCRSNGLEIRRTDWRFAFNERLNRHGSSAPCLKFGKTDNIHIEGNIDSYSSDAYITNSYATGLKIINNILNGGNLIRIADVTEVEYSGNTPELEILDNTHLL